MPNEVEAEIGVLDDTPSSQKPILLFGKDVREIRCFRDSFICGICCGVVGGLGSFLFTSKIRFSTNMAMASIWVGVLSFWFPCRYKYETSMYLLEAAKSGKLKVVDPESKGEKPAS